MKHNHGKHIYLLIYLVLQISLYIVFMILDIIDKDVSLSNNLKFAFILICFCYALYVMKGVSRSFFVSQDRPSKVHLQHQLLVVVALFFTVISDLFILILDYYLYGVITFIVVQQLYGFRLDLFNQKIGLKTTLQWLSIQALLAFIIAIILHFLKVEIDILLIVSIYYFICILMNVVRAIKLVLTETRSIHWLKIIHKPGNRHKLGFTHGNSLIPMLFRRNLIVFTLGMFLFLLCDINVGLFNLTGYVSMPDNMYMNVYQVSSLLMWGFYAPSQLLISLSLFSAK